MTALRKEAVYKKEGYTIEDIYALPEGERAELINGQIYYMDPPSRSHQRVVLSLSRKIADYIEANKGNCEIYAAPFAVFLNDDDSNYVEPDISVICDTSKLDERGCHGVPDWIIEVVSPRNKQMDYLTKLLKYSNANVREYWIVDPTRELVTVYEFEKETMEQYSFGENIPVGIWEDFSIQVV